MPVSNIIKIDFLRQLYHEPVRHSDLKEAGISYEDLAEELSKEGCILENKQDVVSWTNKSGFGPLCLSAMCEKPVFFAEECTSTNTWARETVLQEGVTEGIFVGLKQTAGRGRMGRDWSSDAEQSLVVSLVVSPPLSVEKSALCSLVWMADIAKALDLHVKWPNDLITAEGKKVGGCLTELVDSKPVIIFGLGVNVGHTTAPLETASSFVLEGISMERSALLQLVEKVVFMPRNYSLDVWRERSLYMGQKIRVNNTEGIMTGIRDDGALLLDDAPILTGDVELLEDCR